VFIDYLNDIGKVGSIRILVNDQHEYVSSIKKIGFIKRKPDAILLFKTIEKTLIHNGLVRFVTIGDKDI
jgi:hypothetical protein